MATAIPRLTNRRQRAVTLRCPRRRDETSVTDSLAVSRQGGKEMSETPSQQTPVVPAEQAVPNRPAGSATIRPARRKGRARQIALIAVASLVAVVGVVALGGFLAVRHLEGNIHRIPNVFTRLTAVTAPVMPSATRHSMTILLTGSDTVPAHRGGSGVLGSSTAPQEPSALVSLVHINASKKAGAIVNIPANVVVHI